MLIPSLLIVMAIIVNIFILFIYDNNFTLFFCYVTHNKLLFLILLSKEPVK